jgi:hypothetical protein
MTPPTQFYNGFNTVMLILEPRSILDQSSFIIPSASISNPNIPVEATILNLVYRRYLLFHWLWNTFHVDTVYVDRKIVAV